MDPWSIGFLVGAGVLYWRSRSASAPRGEYRYPLGGKLDTAALHRFAERGHTRADDLSRDEGAGGVIDAVIDANRDSFHPLDGFAEGAAGGALTGAALGPVGAAIGAVVGGVARVIGQIFEQEHGEDLIRQTIKASLKQNGLASTALHVDYIQHLLFVAEYPGQLGVLTTARTNVERQRGIGSLAWIPGLQQGTDSVTIEAWANSYFASGLTHDWRYADPILRTGLPRREGESAGQWATRVNRTNNADPSRLFVANVARGVKALGHGIPYLKTHHLKLGGLVADNGHYDIATVGRSRLHGIHAGWLYKRLGVRFDGR